MTPMEKAKHEAAYKLAKFVNASIAKGGIISIQNPEALAVVDAISAHVIATIEHYLQEQKRTSNGN